jgi:hypothetical protein
MGISTGGEYLDNRKDFAPHLSLFAPIGLELARSKKGHSNSAFFSLIDLGSIVSYRFTSDSSDGIPEDFKLKSILSPGIFYIYGIKKTPLSCGAGIQFTGELRKINFERSSSLKFSLFLAADIPFFLLSSKK